LSDSLAAFTKSVNRVSDPQEEEVDCKNHAYVRGIRDVAMKVEFRVLSGRWTAFDYHHLCVCWFGQSDAAQEIGLRFGQLGGVTITGRNLRPMYELILRHRVTWVREEGPERLADPRAQGESRVYRIVVELAES
jgi:hypothetical protein